MLSNCCCIQMHMEFNDSKNLNDFLKEFKKHLICGTIFNLNYNEDEDEDGENDLYINDVIYEVKDKVIFKLNMGKVLQSWSDENTDMWKEFIQPFSPEFCEILYAERGVGFIGKVNINETINDDDRMEIYEKLEDYLQNNELSLAEDIIDFIGNEYYVDDSFYIRVYDETEIDLVEKCHESLYDAVCNIIVEEENRDIKNLEEMSKEDFFEYVKEEYRELYYDFINENEYLWFEKNDYDSYYKLWCNSC